MPAIDFARIFRAIGLRGFLAIAFAVALVIAMWRADAISDQREDARNALATETAQHAVTRQSLETLTYEMARLVQEGEARAERVDEAMMRVAEETAPLRRRAEQIERDGLGEDYVNDLREAGI